MCSSVSPGCSAPYIGPGICTIILSLIIGGYRLANILGKLKETRERVAGSIEDVPDNLIGTIITLVLLTLIGLGALLLLGYFATNP